MGVNDDVKAAQDALAKVASDLVPVGEVESGTYTKTATANGIVIELTPGAPPAPPTPPGEPT